MPDQVSVGEYRLEISGEEVLVRDESGAVVDSVGLDEAESALTLPDGRTIDLASIFPGSASAVSQAPVDPANDNAGSFIDSADIPMPFQEAPGGPDGPGLAGAAVDAPVPHEITQVSESWMVAGLVSDVPPIDAAGSGANNVLLSIGDVLDMSDGDNRLTIIGEEGDTVTLTGNGGNHWTVIGSNAEFTTYAYSDPSMQAVVEISNQLNAQVS